MVKGRVQPLYENEVKAILKAASSSQRDYLILRLFAKTGLRQGELFRIKPHDVDYARKVIYIPIAKRGERREVPIDTQTSALLKRWIKTENGDKRSIWGLSERTLRRIPGRYAQIAGITKVVSCHSLRHFFCTLLIRNGMSEFRVQKLMGHRRVDTTLLYAHLVTQDCQTEYDRIMNKW